MPQMYSVKGGTRTAFGVDGFVPHLSGRDAVYVVRFPAEGLPAFFICFMVVGILMFPLGCPVTVLGLHLFMYGEGRSQRWRLFSFRYEPVRCTGSCLEG